MPTESVSIRHCPSHTLLTYAVPKFILSRQPVGTKAFLNGHYLLPDTNVLLTGMDLFEDSSHFHDVIVLQTVLEELKARSLPVYNRLMALTRKRGQAILPLLQRIPLRDKHQTRRKRDSQ